MLSLMLAALSCLSSCTTVNSDYCPVWPTAGPAVAAELEKRQLFGNSEHLGMDRQT